MIQASGGNITPMKHRMRKPYNYQMRAGTQGRQIRRMEQKTFYEEELEWTDEEDNFSELSSDEVRELSDELENTEGRHRSID